MKVSASLVLALCAWLGVSAGVYGQVASDPDFRVTLLGTGGPPPDPDRFGPATLVEAGSQKLLFDVGRGVPVRLWQLRVPLRAIDATFLTHLHSDHVVGIPDVWLSGWLGGPFAQRRTPFRIVGPRGTQDLMSHLARAYAADIAIRIADENYPREGIRVVVDEFAGDGVVFDREGVRVTAFEVDHGEHIRPAFGYRVDYDGRSVIISGDTRLSENLVAHSAGADLVIHEVAAVRPELLGDPQVKRVLAHHTTPQEVGTLLSRIKPKLGVYSHLVLLARKETKALTPTELVDQTRETYDGPLEVGEDLMTLEVGRDRIAVHRRMPIR